LDELEKLQHLHDEFVLLSSKINEDDLSFYDRGAIGYYLHNFYNGCENIFTSVARFFENDLRSDSWHSDLLKRMNLEIEGFRPRLIDTELYRLLNDFRGFRHKFRHSYGFELDWEKERIVAKKLPKTYALLSKQVRFFLEQLDAIHEQITPLPLIHSKNGSCRHYRSLEYTPSRCVCSSYRQERFTP
jgi:uncharacterized protein YutE (UPF0331/DUF86 family)